MQPNLQGMQSLEILYVKKKFNLFCNFKCLIYFAISSVYLFFFIYFWLDNVFQISTTVLHMWSLAALTRQWRCGNVAKASACCVLVLSNSQKKNVIHFFLHLSKTEINPNNYSKVFWILFFSFDNLFMNVNCWDRIFKIWNAPFPFLVLQVKLHIRFQVAHDDYFEKP